MLNPGVEENERSEVEGIGIPATIHILMGAKKGIHALFN